jgi:MraZ protein
VVESGFNVVYNEEHKGGEGMADGLLTGEFAHTMDGKGRIKLPAAWEHELESKFMVMRGAGRMLFVFSMNQWNNFTKKLMELPLLDENAQRLRRVFGAGAFECEVDNQGRFLVPQRLREYAHLEKDVIIAGAFIWGEIWNARTYEEDGGQYADGASESFLRLMDTVSRQFSL